MAINCNTSLVADYHLSQRTDVPPGYVFPKENGTALVGDDPTNYIVAAGMRIVFEAPRTALV